MKSFSIYRFGRKRNAPQSANPSAAVSPARPASACLSDFLSRHAAAAQRAAKHR